MSTWNTQNNHFPLSTGALGQRSLQGQSRAIRTAFQNFGGVEVSMVKVAATGATETLCRARSRIDVPADGAGLRAVSGGDFDQPPPLPGELVAKHLDQAPPAGAEDSPGEPGIGADHIADLKTLDDHRTVALGIGARERVQAVLALPAYLAVQPVDASDGFLSFPGSFLTARDDALSTGKPFQGAFEVSRVWHERAIGVADQIADAAIECHDRLCFGCWFGHLQLRAQVLELVDLIEGSEKDAFIARTGETHLSLLESKVPEEPQRAFPSEKPRFLRGRGIHSVPDCHAHEHLADNSSCSFASERVFDSGETNNVRAPIATTSRLWRSPSRGRETPFPTTVRRGFLRDLKDGVFAPETP